jgi:hypothetical protein
LITASNDAASTGTSLKYAVDKDCEWNLDLCLAAAPISQWTNDAYVWMFVYGFSTLIWTLNTLFDNRGGSIHWLFWRQT